jgi:hypothetical protein
MKYYERGSLADISTRARVSGKAFSQNVWFTLQYSSC